MSATTIPTIHDPASHDTHPLPSPLSSSDVSIVTSEDDAHAPSAAIAAVPSTLSNPASSSSSSSSSRLSRPHLGSRKSSGTMIVSRESTSQTVVEDEIDVDDVRNMSPRRNSDEVERLTSDARRDLIEQAKVLQTSLQAIVDRVETVKSEHEKLEGGNKFLQSYIGELMQTSKITSTSVSSKSKGKAKGRSGK